MNEKITKLFRAYCPNIPALHRWLSSMKLKEINRYLMKPEDVQAGEASEAEQGAIVEKYSRLWPDHARMLNDKLDEYIARCAPLRERDDLADLRKKALFACLAYGFMPDEFFAFQLEKKDAAQRKSYISCRELNNYVYELNDIIDIDIFWDKYESYKKLKKYYGREAICVEKASDYSIFSDFAAKHPVFVKKKVRLSKGDSVELIDTAACGKTTRQLFDEILSEGKHIIEELVHQSADMAALNPSSVNTVRVMTFITRNGVEIGPCFLKVGKAGSFVDNGGAGGLLIGVDKGTGITDTDGFDEFLTCFEEHPATHAKLRGVPLPDWDEALSMVREMSAQTPTVHYVSWDIAHTDRGWVVIEGNGGGQFIGPQIVYQRGFKKDYESFVSNGAALF